MNFNKIKQCREAEDFSFRHSKDLQKPKVESIECHRKAKQREMAVKSILNKASTLDW